MNNRYVLIVDDNLISRTILSNIFNKKYKILEAENGRVGLDFVCKYYESIAVILLDLIMPEMNGYEFLAEIKKRNMLGLIPVVVVSSDSDSSIESNILEQGASDMIATPIVPAIVRQRVENVISANNYRHNLEAMTKSLSHEIQQSNSMIVETLCSIIEQRSLESGQHIKRIRSFTDILLHYLAENYDDVTLDEGIIECISRASTLHDIGKIVIPDSILNKPARLTPSEFEVMKTHSIEGANIIRKLNFIRQKDYLEYAWQIAMYHHERWDGSGYPEGLAGDAIPLCAQAVAVADVYDALTTHRVYKPVISHQKAVVMILNGECGAFSERMKHALRAVAPEFERLAGKFRDGGVPDSFDDVSSKSFGDDVLDKAFRSDYYKYVTSLHLIDGYVFEIDYDTHAYKLVFPNKSPFPALPLHGDFFLDVRVFVDKLIHPEDCGLFLERFQADRVSIENGHYTHSSFEARMRMSDSAEYKNYQFSQIRIDMQSVSLHKSLVVVREAEPKTAQPLENAMQLASAGLKVESPSLAYKSADDKIEISEETSRIGLSQEKLLEVFHSLWDLLAVFNIDDGTVVFDCSSDEFFPRGRPRTIQELFDGDKVNVYPDDVDYFNAMLEEIVLGQLKGCVSFRMITNGDKVCRFFGESVIVNDDHGASFVAVALKIDKFGGE
ncbi:MAG: response regulator [Treponemataceae bacterium]|nr:response regulator [Treponemataceae bacterium]